METNSPHNKVVDQDGSLQTTLHTATVVPLVARRRLRRLQLFLFISLLIFCLFTLAVSLDNDHYFLLDTTISLNLQTLPIPGIETLMRIISLPGDNFLVAVGLVLTTFFLLLRFRYRLEAYALLLSAGGGELLNVTFKWLVGRPRPSTNLVAVMVRETSLSFPSGHVMHYVVFYGLLFFLAYTLLRRSLLRTLLLMILGLLVVLVGMSRVYLGAHWPSDVTAGYFCGSAWLMFVISRYRVWLERNGKG
jgi:undecaprenyl-diphosphatase